MDKRRNSQPDPRRRRTVPTGGRPAVRSGSGGRSAASPGRPAGKRSAAPPSSRGQKGPARVQRGYAPGHVRDPRAERIQEIQQRRKKKRKRNYTLYYILLFFFLTVAGIVLSLTVFFNIRNIEVTGSAIYGVEDVEPLLGVQKGDNLLRISTEKIRQSVQAGLLKSDRVTVRRVFPSTLWIEVIDGVPEIQIESGGNYYSVSRSGRILEIDQELRPDRGVLLVGLDLTGLGMGDSLSVRETAESSASQEEQDAAADFQNRVQAVESLFSALKEARFSGVTAVDVSDELKLTVYWQNRIQVVLGSFSELTYKLQLCRAILEDSSRLSAEARGVLDAETASSAGVFYREDPELAVPGNGSGGVWNWDDGEEGSGEDGAASAASEVSSEAESGASGLPPEGESSVLETSAESGGGNDGE